MGVRSIYFTKKFVIPVILWLMALFAWGEFFAKPFINQIKSQNGAWPAAIGDLFQLTPTAFGWPFSGYIFIAISILVTITTIILIFRPIRYLLGYLEISESPISIIHSEFELTLNDDWSTCQSNRIQYVHANRPDVNAYHYSLSPYYGSIQVKEIKSELNGKRKTKAVRDHSRGDQKEFIEEFDGSLPLSFFMTYFPDKWVYWTHINWKWFKKTLIRRTVNTIERNEYNTGSPTFQVQARYPVSGLKISVRFPERRCPPDDQVKAYFIEEGAIRYLDLRADFDSGYRVFAIEFGKLGGGQKLRLTWPLMS